MRPSLVVPLVALVVSTAGLTAPVGAAPEIRCTGFLPVTISPGISTSPSSGSVAEPPEPLLGPGPGDAVDCWSSIDPNHLGDPHVWGTYGVPVPDVCERGTGVLNFTFTPPSWMQPPPDTITVSVVSVRRDLSGVLLPNPDPPPGYGGAVARGTFTLTRPQPGLWSCTFNGLTDARLSFDVTVVRT